MICDAAEKLLTNAENSFESAVQQRLDKLCLVAGNARRAWVETSVEM